MIRHLSAVLALAGATLGLGDELSIPGRWPTDLSPTLDEKAVVLVGGRAMGGGGKIDLVCATGFKILKTAPLPENQAASSVTIVPFEASPRGAAVIAMDTQSIGQPQAIYMVSLDDATFGEMMWKWTAPDTYGSLFDFSNAAVGRDASGKYVYVASGSYKNAGRLYRNDWWLHVLDITGSDPTVVQTVQLPSYSAKSHYEGFGVFPSPDGHVLVNSNMAGVDGAGSPVVLVENAAAASRTVRNVTFGGEGKDPAFANVLGWDASGKGFYADVSLWTAGRKHLSTSHVHHDLSGVDASSVAKDQENYYYGKGFVSGEGGTVYGTVYYPTYSGYGPLKGLLVAIDAKSVEDKPQYEHSGGGFWAKAVTVAGGKVWVAWQNVEQAKLGRYSAAPGSNVTLLV